MSRGLRWTDEQLAAFEKRGTTVVPAKFPQASKPSKYRNEKTDGYASKKEARRAIELTLLLKTGNIRLLSKQMRYEVIPAQYVDGKLVERACVYVADFRYEERQPGSDTWAIVVEDVKGIRTSSYIIKRKLMLQRYNIRIREV